MRLNTEMSTSTSAMREGVQMPTALDAATWARLSGLFDSARDLPQDALPQWLSHLTADQPDLAPWLPWLQDMLAAHATRHTADWLERGPQLHGTSAAADSQGLSPGDRVGPWVLQDLLGSGGMATVWRASRADALPARDVALKLPLQHRAGSQLVERFAREREILARLAHPHIAPLFAAGVAENGTPWLAMECVQGQPIDRWCDERRLNINARLALFAQVLDAVQYAHSRLVIHRDLKPSNILVTAEGQVRLLDFGIAKLLADDSPADATALTQASGRAMTPAYAAPEQVRGEALTTAADIYALGVVLFELLTGRSPYPRGKLHTAAQFEALVASAQVQRASDAVDQIVSDKMVLARSTTPRALRRTLTGDLNTILAKALALDPVRRYAGAAAFADDVQRFLTGRPVAAQPDAWWYRLRKTVARNRWQAAAVFSAVLSLTTGLGAALWQALEAAHERDIARVEAERSSAINFFYSDLLEDAGRNNQAIDGPALVARAETLARRELKGNPDALAAVFSSIGMLHQSQGRREQGRRITEEAHALARDPAFRDDIACDLALMLDDTPRAVAMLTAVADKPHTSARSRAACLVYLGDLLRNGDANLALHRYQQALSEWQRTPSRSPHDHITILGRLAFVAALQGRTADAVREYTQALALADTQGRDGTPMSSALRNRLGRTWLIAGRPEVARPMFELLLAEHAQRDPAALPPTDVLINAGQALLDLQEGAAARVPLLAAVAAASAAQHAPRWMQAQCLLRWAAALDGAGLRVAAPVPASSSPATGDVADAMARAACALADAHARRANQQWALLDQGLSPWLGQVWPEPQWAVDARLLRGQARLEQGQREEAAADARAALSEARRLQFGEGDSTRVQTASALLARAEGLPARKP